MIEISCRTHRYARFDLKITPKEGSIVINPDKIRIVSEPGNRLIDNAIWKYKGDMINDTVEIEMGESLSFDFRDYSVWNDAVENNINPRILVIVEPYAVICDETSVNIDTLKINLINQ